MAKPKAVFTDKLDQMKDAVTAMVDAGIALSEAVEAFRAYYVTTAIKMSKGNKCRAAKQINTHRNTIARIVPGKFARRIGGEIGPR